MRLAMGRGGPARVRLALLLVALVAAGAVAKPQAGAGGDSPGEYDENYGDENYPDENYPIDYPDNEGTLPSACCPPVIRRAPRALDFRPLHFPRLPEKSRRRRD